MGRYSMDIGLILVVLGTVILWFIGLGVTAVGVSTQATLGPYNEDEADAIGGVAVLTYVAFSLVALGVYL